MISKDMMIKILGQMDTPSLLKAMSATGIKISPEDVEGGTGDPTLDGMAAGGPNDPNRIKGWSELKIPRKPDDRPTLADKSYMDVKKPEAPPMQGQGAPNEYMQTGMDPYAYDPGSGT